MKGFQSWGVLGDWKNEQNLYKTYSPEYIKNQLQMFYKLYEKGLIYVDRKPVFWSPSSHSALAESELEYDPKYKSPSLYFRVKLKKHAYFPEQRNVYALVWTTTPWTLPANKAISFNKDIEYCLVYINNDRSCCYLLATDCLEVLLTELDCPIEVIRSIDSDKISEFKYEDVLGGSESLPFLCSQHVKADKGTGLVHTAPSHGMDDFLVGLKHNIPLVSICNRS